jgi:predicted dienelactone hydrolase
MSVLTATLALMAGLSASGGAPASAAVGVVEMQLVDQARTDALAGGQRAWRVELYYPAKAGTGTPRPYAHDKALLARMAQDGYYEVAPEVLAAWSRQPGPARRDASAVASALPLVTLSPGSGLAAFNYAQLASAIARRGYAVAVVDHPYLGLSGLPDGRIVSGADDPLQQDQDPRAWLPRVIDWSRDVSATLDALPRQAPVQGAGVRLDMERIVAVGHSLGGTVAVEVCAREPRVSACADFEGVVEGTTAYVDGPRRPTLLALSRSAKPDRPHATPDLTRPPFDFLARGGLATNWAVAISGGSHMSFSDAPREMPATLSRFGGTLMAADRSDEVYAGIVDALARAFLPGGTGNAHMGAYFREVPEAKAIHSGSGAIPRP